MRGGGGYFILNELNACICRRNLLLPCAICHAEYVWKKIKIIIILNKVDLLEFGYETKPRKRLKRKLFSFFFSESFCCSFGVIYRHTDNIEISLISLVFKDSKTKRKK